MNELLIKFESDDECNKFIEWLCEYGQYEFKEDVDGDIQNFDLDAENNIINF